MKVLIVDDSLVVRSIVTRVLSAADGIEVVGTAGNGRVALEKVRSLAPDLVTMDVEMPVMDGIAAVRALRAAGHRMPVIMFSTLTERGAAATIEALTAGATDYVTKPTGNSSMQASLGQVADELVPKIRALAPARLASAPTPAPRAARSSLTAGARPRLVLVGSSTGGPAALAVLLRSLTGPLPVPVLITQHMPALFTRQLSERLGQGSPASISEATHGAVLESGHVYVAPGGRHLQVTAGVGGILRSAVVDTPPVNYCKPSVDVLYDSALRAVDGRELLAVVLTGMGADGAAGAARIAAAGGTVIAQDRDSSVVWGMPGATVARGAAHAVLPLEEIGPALERVVRGGAR